VAIRGVTSLCRDFGEREVDVVRGVLSPPWSFFIPAPTCRQAAVGSEILSPPFRVFLLVRLRVEVLVLFDDAYGFFLPF